MSRVGNNPVTITKGVEVKLSGQKIDVKGPKGTLTYLIPDEILASVEGDKVSFKPANDSRKGDNKVKAKWGLSRALLNNMIKGVTAGYTINLEIQGVGFKAASQGKVVKLNLGFSHDIDYKVPEGVEIKTPKPTEISISGIDRRLVGQVAAEIRSLKKPEPYKGKGIRYSGEYVRSKEGKKK
ncbi:MAG: 50S ribosomal protein L6 [Rickettsiales bacterium]|nr:50S ribosomal protein L6 [Rickettsiales bacterium]